MVVVAVAGGVILIGGVAHLRGFIWVAFHGPGHGGVPWGVIPLSGVFPDTVMSMMFVKDAAFGLAICGFLIYEPKGLFYRWWQIKNYFNFWPFSY